MEIVSRKRYCCKYPGCNNWYYSKVSEGFVNKHFFRFPADQYYHDLWRKICNVESSQNSKFWHVCEDHFTNSSFVNKGKDRLNIGAVPFVKPSEVDNTLLLEDLPFPDENSKPISPKIRCAVSGCATIEHNKRQKNVFFFPFSKNAVLRTAWINACGRSDDFATDSAQICQLHFDQNDYERIIIPNENCTSKNYLQLKSHVIPTLNLPKLSKTGNHDDVSSNRNYSDTASKGNVDQIGENTMIKRKKCAIIDCTSQSETIFDFPDYQLHRSLYLKWLFLCKNDALKNLEPDDLSKSYGICRTHLNENGTVILHNQVPILNLPGKNLIPGHLETQTKEEAHEASQLCRLCFSIGSVNLFSKYNQKIVKNIVTMFVPIKIKGDDVSKLICENCKYEVFRFYQFLIKSVQVDEFFEAINKEANKRNRTGDSADDPSEKTPIEIEEDVKLEKNSIIEEESASSIQCPTSQAAVTIQDEIVIKENDTTHDDHAPSKVMEDIHNQTSNNDRKRKANSDSNQSLQSEDTAIICIHCNQSIESLDAFNEHCRLENHDPILTCSDCNRMFKTEADLNIHYNYSHRKNEGNVCDQCGKEYKKRQHLSNHLISVHNKNGLKYDCKVCSKKFSTNSRLKLHSRIHTKGKQYCCERCGGVFACLSTLKYHQAKHSGQKPHVCLICKKSFFKRYSLVIHLKQHTVETTLACDRCGITYKRHLNFKKHIQKCHPNPNEVTDAKPRVRAKNFECHVCEKKFTQRSILQTHILIHTGEKPHKCRFCSKSFTQLSGLVVHERIHTGETPYMCRFCNKGFAHLMNFKRHMSSKHAVIINKKKDYSSDVSGKERSEGRNEGKAENLEMIEIPTTPEKIKDQDR